MFHNWLAHILGGFLIDAFKDMFQDVFKSRR